MNNLKRVLSIGLTGTMLAGMMAIGAGAVDASDFTDASEITHTDAVNTMVALNIINGKDTGAFDPEGTVTRAEMAKMITVALNGGKDFTYGTKTEPTFSDIDGHWAESYIEYCAATGIINGQGDGTFAPAATVTGSQAAKMLLTAMGYNATNAGMVGVDWEINTNVLAGSKDLYKDLDIDVSAPLDRDDAAQMLYNGVRATMVEYTYNAQTVNGTLTMVPQVKEKTHFVGGTEYKTTILTEKFGMSEAEGILNGITYIESNKKEPEKFVYTINTEDDVVDVNTNDTITFDGYTTDYSALLGEKVNTLYKVENGKNVLYGIYGISDSADTISQGEISRKSDGTIDGTKKNIKADGVTYTLTDTASAIKYYTYDNTAGKLVAGNELDDLNTDVDAVSTVKLVSNRVDGKYEYAIVTPAKVAKISYLGSSSITMNNGVGAYDLDDVTIYDGAKKDDYVIFTSDAYTIKGVATIAETDTVSGSVDAMRNTDEIYVNGTWYKRGGTASAPSINDDVTLVIVGGYYYDADATSNNSIDNILFVAEAVNKTTVGDGKVEASVAFADGSISVINISEVDGTTAAKGNSYGTAGQVVEGGMYTYEKTSSGSYELTKLADTNNNTRAGFAEFKNGASTFVSSTTKPTAAGNAIADDAVVFIRSSGDAKTKVITGAELKEWNANWGSWCQTLSNKVNGVMTAKAVALIDTAALPASQGNANYGYVVTAAKYQKISGTSYAVLTIWDGSQEVEMKSDKIWDDSSAFVTPSASNVEGATAVSAIKAGAFVQYETLSNGDITNLKPVGIAAALVGTYVDRNGDTTLTFENDAYTGNSDSVDALVNNKSSIIYVNTDKGEGASGSGFELATETAISGYYIKNVVYAATAGKLDVIFVDVANNLDGNSSAKTATGSVLSANVGFKGTSFYTNGTTINASDITAPATAGAGAIEFVGALAVSVTDAQGNVKTGATALVANDVITVVACDGSTASYVVNTGDLANA